ncbi:cyclic nucleotide-binding domain-containing protein [Streptomyces sp. NPDC054884]|uniref:cyclic nucleotide-binding domain-containing protein n=1 Tax=unclassified Streptomyces TaxID=2593676 RepID=UPI0029B0FE3F|nr:MULTISPECIES: cyclic nucleotide-binding domain-containing protein [unclassified Streptomyces]MDX3308838.1 cyclic nucleotide-binding domain-containing protein [Streptomyces sp. ME08-AFT2]MDX3802823.1 cyclic nucleotide-binding domain-containing protein [Streptomyces sp. AK04-3B]
MTRATKLLTALPPPQRQRLMALAREVSFPEDARIFEAGGTADRFWILRSGAVSLVQQVTSLRRVTVAGLGSGDLLGWSWLFPPYRWDFGAEAFSPVRAYEFEAQPVLKLCEEDPALGLTLVRIVAEILAHRLEMTRGKLMEQYGTHRRGVL